MQQASRCAAIELPRTHDGVFLTKAYPRLDGAFALPNAV